MAIHLSNLKRKIAAEPPAEQRSIDDLISAMDRTDARAHAVFMLANDATREEISGMLYREAIDYFIGQGKHDIAVTLMETSGSVEEAIQTAKTHGLTARYAELLDTHHGINHARDAYRSAAEEAAAEGRYGDAAEQAKRGGFSDLHEQYLCEHRVQVVIANIMSDRHSRRTTVLKLERATRDDVFSRRPDIVEGLYEKLISEYTKIEDYHGLAQAARLMGLQGEALAFQQMAIETEFDKGEFSRAISHAQDMGWDIYAARLGASAVEMKIGDGKLKEAYDLAGLLPSTKTQKAIGRKIVEGAIARDDFAEAARYSGMIGDTRMAGAYSDIASRIDAARKWSINL